MDNKIVVEQWSIGRLRPFERNARTHSDEQIEQIAASIREWGWTMPILADEGGSIVAGHARLRAAQLLGMEEVPVIVARGWNDAQRRAYILADNKLALNSAWDFSLMAMELQELDTGAFDMELLGFSNAELEQIATWTPPQPQAEQRGTADNYSGGGTGQLSERFMLPPFSILNAREGWWQDRKARWIALGIKSEVGRAENMLQFSEAANAQGPKGKRAAAVASR